MEDNTSSEVAASGEVRVPSASNSYDTMVLMLEHVPLIVTDDAAWGQLLLGRAKPEPYTPMAAFLEKFREHYDVQPAENAGGVICTRRT